MNPQQLIINKHRLGLAIMKNAVGPPDEKATTLASLEARAASIAQRLRRNVAGQEPDIDSLSETNPVGYYFCEVESAHLELGLAHGALVGTLGADHQEAERAIDKCYQALRRVAELYNRGLTLNKTGNASNAGSELQELLAAMEEEITYANKAFWRPSAAPTDHVRFMSKLGIAALFGEALRRAFWQHSVGAVFSLGTASVASTVVALVILATRQSTSNSKVLALGGISGGAIGCGIGLLAALAGDTGGHSVAFFTAGLTAGGAAFGLFSTWGSGVAEKRASN